VEETLEPRAIRQCNKSRESFYYDSKYFPFRSFRQRAANGHESVRRVFRELHHSPEDFRRSGLANRPGRRQHAVVPRPATAPITAAVRADIG